MINSIDLHTHSTASDGTLTPSELAVYAKEKGLKAIALTDHDTINGISEFSKKCAQLGIEAVSGVEISADYKCEMHIVGLFVDTHNEEFAKKLSDLKNARSIRNQKMIECLNEHGMPITADDLLSQADDLTLESIGRPHSARAMVNHGYVRDIPEAFEKYLAHGKDCYVSRIKYSPKDSIRLIKDAGGLAILAHPVYISDNEDDLYDLLHELKGFGLDGTECFYSTYSKDFSDVCQRLCKRLDLLPSGGSDFHGGNKSDIDLACVDIPYSVLEEMKKRL